VDPGETQRAELEPRVVQCVMSKLPVRRPGKGPPRHLAQVMKSPVSACLSLSDGRRGRTVYGQLRGRSGYDPRCIHSAGLAAGGRETPAQDSDNLGICDSGYAYYINNPPRGSTVSLIGIE
jgi:hypothetical protein